MACSSSSSSASTSVAYGVSTPLAPIRWFSRTDSEIKSFQLLIKNFIQLSSFEENEKPYIDRETRTITVDRSYNWIVRWWWGAFYTDYIDILCRDLFYIMEKAQEPIEKSMSGFKLTKREAWNVQKAFIISELIQKGNKGKKLQDGIENLKKTYSHKPKIQKQLTTLMNRWESTLLFQSKLIMRRRETIEKILTLWNKILNESQSEERLKRGRFPSRTSLRSVAASSTPAASQTSISSNKTDTPNATPPSDPIISRLEDTVKQLIVDPHKKTIKQAGPSFLDTLKRKLMGINLNRASLIDEVEKLRQKRIDEVNHQSRLQHSRYFNNTILGKAQATAPQEGANGMEKESDEFKVSEPLKFSSSVEPQLIRSVSQAVFSIADTKAPLQRVGSELLDKDALKQALEKRFQHCINSSDDSAPTWSSDEESEQDI